MIMLPDPHNDASDNRFLHFDFEEKIILFQRLANKSDGQY
jgi:hypothetical protein